tara:strand:- start:767 stop:1582 length:816 start_codon:yes stop_codon:yes gene_type:complete
MINEEGTHAAKTNFIPHAIPDNLFHPISEKLKAENKLALFGESKKDSFVGIWVNRNAKRKRPNDVLLSWKLFVDKLQKEKGHTDAILIMHTEPTDQEGPNLFETAKALGLEDTVFFSRERIDFDKMNILYNISDFCITMSYAEGFGLSTLESMMTGTPVISPTTGGLTRQVVDHRDQTENGVAMPIELRTLVGSQGVPYIYEDYVSCDTAANAIMKINNLSKYEKELLDEKVLKYSNEEFGHQTTVDLWHESMLKTIEDFKEYKAWQKFTF